MKVMTILGTRPEIIRLSRIIPKLDKLCDHTLVHTGQNYDPNLSDVFFGELGLRKPDVKLDVRSSEIEQQIANVLAFTGRVLASKKPDRVLVLGDTNSGLSVIAAKRLGIPVYHLEAGNRCYDDRVPEEINRRVIDHCSDVLMPYTERSRANLLREGIDGQRIFVVGNPIKEVLRYSEPESYASTIFSQHKLARGRYFLVTVHRAENVDVEHRLREIVLSLAGLHEKYDYPVLCSMHPHTRQRMVDFDIEARGIRVLEPFGFYEFVALERNAFCVVSDSGTVPEECCILGVPSVSLRDVTERPEMFERGGSILAGVRPDDVFRAVKVVTSSTSKWTPPPEYMRTDVSDTVVKIVLGL